MKEYKYTDSLSRELKVKFTLGGFNDDIPICTLYRLKRFANGLVERWIKVFDGVSTDSIEKASNWTKIDYDAFAEKVIEKYNIERVSKEKFNKSSQKLNQI